MHILRFHIDGYGRFHDWASPEIGPGLTVFKGPNEAGKSTLVAFVRSLLFGFPDGRARDEDGYALNRYEPLAGGRHGGAIEVLQNGQRYRIERHSGRRKAGDLRIFGQDHQLDEAEALETLLRGMGQKLYENVFAFGLQELERLASLQDQEVSGYIYSAGLGTGGVSIVEVEKRLVAGMERLFKPRGHAGPRINALLKEFADQETVIHRLSQEQQEYGEVLRQLEQVHGDLDQASGQLRQLDDQWDWWSRLQQAWPLWEGLQGMQEELRALEAGEGEQLAQNALLLLRSEIEGLIEERPLFRQALQELPGARTKLGYRRQEWKQALQQLGPGWDEERVGEFDTSIPLRSRVSEFEQILRQAGERMTEAERDLERARQQSKETKETWQELSRQIDRPNDHKQVSDAGAKPRVPPEERETALENLRLALTEQERQMDRLSLLGAHRVQQQERRQFLQQVAAGAGEEEADGVSAGWLLLAASLIGGAAALWTGSGVGAGMAGLLLLVSLFLLSQARGIRGRKAAPVEQRKEEARQHLSRLDQALEELDRQYEEARRVAAKEEREAHEAALVAAGRAPLSLRDIPALDRALKQERQKEMGRLGLIERREEARKQVEKNEAHLEKIQDRWEQARSAFDQAQSAWTGWLEEYDLEPGLAPETVLELLTQIRGARQILQNRQSAAGDVEQREIRVRQYTARTNQVLIRLNRPPVGQDDVPGTVGELEQQLARVDEVAGRRRELAGQIQRLQGSLKAAAPGDPAAFTQVLSETHRQEIEERREAVRQERASARQRRDDLKDLKRELELRREQMEKTAEMAEARQKKATAGALVQQLAEEWAALALTQKLLTLTRERYERERQPRVLQEASGLFRAITTDRYTRVVSPLGEQRIVVERADGERLDTSRLSRGTREQLFLAMRLALVKEYHRRSGHLPVLMDDVFVNFDAGRRDQALRVLLGLTQGEEAQQLLFFTCHDHTADHLKRLAPDVAMIRVEAGGSR